MLLIRTNMKGTPIDIPRKISKDSIPLHGSEFYCKATQNYYQHVVNHSYTADDNHSLFNSIIHAIYTEK